MTLNHYTRICCKLVEDMEISEMDSIYPLPCKQQANVILLSVCLLTVLTMGTAQADYSISDILSSSNSKPAEPKPKPAPVPQSKPLNSTTTVRENVVEVINNPKPVAKPQPQANNKPAAENKPEADGDDGKASDKPAAPRSYNPAHGQRLVDAVRGGKIHQVRWLLKAGADPEFKGEHGVTPLYQAVRSGWIELVQLFAENGANLKSVNENGTTYLHIAAASGKLKMVEFLIEQGVSPHARTEKDWSALHHAARFGHSDVVQYLLSRGVSANRWNSDGFTPRALALHARQYQAAHLLQRYTTVEERLPLWKINRLKKGLPIN